MGKEFPPGKGKEPLAVSQQRQGAEGQPVQRSAFCREATAVGGHNIASAQEKSFRFGSLVCVAVASALFNAI